MRKIITITIDYDSAELNDALDQTLKDAVSDAMGSGMFDDSESSAGIESWSVEVHDEETVQCSRCTMPTSAKTAHLHQGTWIGDACCWDERFRSTE